MINIAQRLKNEARGATAIEYGLIAALVALAFIVGAAQTGSSLSSLFSSIKFEIDQARCVQVGSNCNK